jgi:hypothetical protein
MRFAKIDHHFWVIKPMTGIKFLENRKLIGLAITSWQHVDNFFEMSQTLFCFMISKTRTDNL